MNNFLESLPKIFMWACILLVTALELRSFIKTEMNVNTFEIMAKKDKCNFMVPSASSRDVGMFECDGKIVFKKIEN